MDNILRNIPKEERQKVCESVINIGKNIYNTSLIAEDIEYLFELWNEYVQPSNKQSISCKGCRTAVFSKYKHYVREWKEWKELGAYL
jgi:hypothetical protein